MRTATYRLRQYKMISGFIIAAAFFAGMFCQHRITRTWSENVELQQQAAKSALKVAGYMKEIADSAYGVMHLEIVDSLYKGE